MVMFAVLVALTFASATIDLGPWKRSGVDKELPTAAENRAALANGAELGFEIVLGIPCDTNTPETVVSQGDMRKMSERTVGGVRTIVWEGSSKAGAGLVVTATLEPKEEGLFEWSFRYDGLETDREVVNVHFPMVTLPYERDSRVLRPWSQGMLVGPDWDAEPCGKEIKRLSSRMWPYKISALVNEGRPSFYMDRRADDFASVFSRWKKVRKGVVATWFDHTLPVRPETKAAQSLAGRGRIGFYEGGWWEAAMLYRPWARSRAIYRRAKARDFSQLRDIGLWMWNRGRIDYVVPPVKRFMKDSGVPVAIDWYWWHSNPYDTSYPNFWPPREGVEKFTAAVKDLTDSGVYSQVYINGARWDCDDPSYAEGGREDELIFRNGLPDAHMYNPFTRHRLTQMCGEAPHYQARVIELTKKLRSTGLTGLYMDQIAMSAYQPCYQKAHRHAPGDASATVKGFRDYVSRVQEANPGWPLSGEDVSEAYMDLFKSGIVCYSSVERYRGRYGFKPTETIEMIPLYNALYHGSVVVFGSFATMDGITPWDELWPQERRWKVEKDWHRLFPDQYAVEFCRGVVWGQQPTVHNFKVEFADRPEFAEDYRFTVDTARFYYAHRDWLFDGEMLAPGMLECAGRDVDFLVRGVFAKEGDYMQYRGKGLPAVLHSVWRAPDGRIGAALVNWTRDSQPYALRTPDMGERRGVLPARSWAWIEKKTEDAALLRKASPAAFDVTRYGALADGSSDSTAALQRAIDECAAAGGGTVVVPPGGVYVSRRLSLRSNVELRIDEGATLRCSDEIEKFPRYEPTDVWRWDRPVRWNSYAFFYTCGQTNVAITGKGTIDGNSTSERFHVRVDGAYLRTSDTNIVARGLFFAGCRGVRIEGIRYVNPCGWATWFLDCDDVRVRNVTIRCDRERPNGDGLHFGGCRDVSVSECDIDANDDAIIVRSHQEQMRSPRPCERVRVENCRLRSNQYAVRFGWTCDAPVKDCVFRNIDCPYSNRGLGFALPRIFDPSYTRDPPRGNGIPVPDFPTVPFALENIRFENMRLTSFTIPFGIMVGACERVAYMRNVCFSNCQFRAQLPPVFKFRQQDRVSDWRFVDVDFSIEKPKGSLTPDMGVWFDNAEDIVMERVRWRCVPRDDPEWRITLRAIANGKWERYRDPKTKYINLRPSAKPKPTLPFEVVGAKLRPRVETAPDGTKRFVYDELTDGIFVWKVRVTLVERVVPTGRRWTVNIENRDPGLEVLGFEGPWERFGDFHPLTSSLSVCGTPVKDFPESGKGLDRISADSVGWVSAGDRDRNRRKEADMRVTEERGRAVYASPWGDSPEARIASGSHSVSVGAATGGTARRVMLRYDHEYGLLDWCLGYRVTIGQGGSASLGAAAN